MIRQLFSRAAAAPAIPPGQRVYAVGDIHGRLDLFDRLLGILREDHARRGSADAVLILLGDLVDRGLNSAGLLRRAMEPLEWARTITIKGNHEATMLDVLDGDRKMVPTWLGYGGTATLQSWGVDERILTQGTIADIIEAARAAVDPAERAWLARMRQSVQVGDFYFVHAGVRPGVPLGQQTAQDNLWIRDEFLDSRRAHGAVVVHGHSISTEVNERPNRIGVDTGAYATGRLTALCLEGSARWFMQT